VVDAPQHAADMAEEASAPIAAKRCMMDAVAHARKMGLARTGDKIVAMYNVEKKCAAGRCSLSPVGRDRARDASGCMRRHQAFALDPVE
jgi:pyruvate kinase